MTTRLPRAGIRLAIAVVALFALTPIAITIVGSFRTSLPGQPDTWGFAGWTSAYHSLAVWRAIGNTIVLVLMRVPLAIVLGSVLAWTLIRTNVGGKKIVEFLFWIAFFLPALPMAMAWSLLLDPKSGWLNRFLQPLLGLHDGPFNIFSYGGITWVHLATTTVPAIVLLLGPAIRGLNPVLEESARMSGASLIAIFRRIVAPLLAPAIAMATIVALMRSLEAFEVEFYLGVPAGVRVLSTQIQQFVVYEPPRYAPAMALSVPLVLLLIVLAVLYQRTIKKMSYATLTGKFSAAPPVDLGRWRVPATIGCVLFAGISVVVPTAALVTGSFMTVFGIASATSGSLGLTFSHWSEVLHDSVFATSLLTTLKLGIGTAAVAVIAYSLLAYVMVRSKIAGRQVLDFVVWMPWAIPGILLSLSLLWIFLGNPVLNVFYGSLTGLILAMLIKEMPGGVNLMKNGLSQIGRELEEAAETSGAGWWATYRRILLPLLTPTAITVAMFVFVGCVKDISTMILLSTPETRPLSLLVLDYSTGGSIEKAAVVGVITTSIAVAVPLLGRRIGRWSGNV